MPATLEAAALTDSYRRRLIVLRDTSAATVVRLLDSIDLDGDVDGQVSAWIDTATMLLSSAQVEAARAAVQYLAAYVTASGSTPARGVVDPADYRGMRLFGRPLDVALSAAPATLLWRLGRSDGRGLAVASGLAQAMRVARSAVMAAGRGAQSDVMDADPSVSGWRRVTSSDPCGACMGAADGRVMRSDAGLEVHDSCRCTAEAVLSGVDNDRLRRPTGQELFDRLDRDGQNAMFEGRGGADKAEVVRREGVGTLIDVRSGRLTETSMSDLPDVA